MGIKQLLLFLSFILNGARVFAGANDTLVVAISKIHKKGQDTAWLRAIEPRIRFVNMYELSIKDASVAFANCDGLLVTGGQDIHPNWYGKGTEVEKCGEFDMRRDTLEMMLIKEAMRVKKPLLAICRGEQVLNACNGGTLFTDIPTDIGHSVAHDSKETDGKRQTAMHEVKVKTGSRLHRLVKQEKENVNSFHHQSVQKVAPGFVAVAHSNDGVVEAIEWTKDSYFALGVQWHPERLPLSSSYSSAVGKAFIDEMRNSQKTPVKASRKKQ